MVPNVLVCGGRYFANCVSIQTDSSEENLEKINQYKFLFQTLDRICIEKNWCEPEYLMPMIRIINGGASGADSAATDYAVVNWCSFKEYPAEWNKYGKSAGPIRNKQMLDEENIDLVIAFPGGRGTANMVKLAKERGIEVIEVEYKNDT